MAAAKKHHPRPDLSEDARQQRQADVYLLHCRGLTLRAIGAELGLDSAQVSRALTQAKAVVRRQKGEEQLADLADRLTEGAWEVIARTYGDTEAARESGDWRAVASLALIQAKMRELIAKFNGLDPLKREELRLRREALEAQKAQAAGSQEVLEALAQGLLCAPPTGPSSPEPEPE